MDERLIVDADTGAVQGTLCSGDRIIRRTSIDYLKRRGEKDRIKRRFIRVDLSEGEKVLNVLSVNEKALLYTLQFYVSYESGLIKYNNGRDIGFNDIVKLMNWSKSTASKAIGRLLEMNILYKGKNGKGVQYFMNPWIASKGTECNDTLYEMFKHYRILSKGGITWGEYLNDKS